jgi:hypothetical protein
MKRFREGNLVASFVGLAVLTGCAVTPQAKVTETDRGDKKPLVQVGHGQSRWYVYKDANSPENHGVWSGWMPAEATSMVTLNMACRDEQDGATGETSIRTGVRLSSPWWCGVAVTCKEGYWGESPYDGAYDLSKAKRLVFKARGEKGGESIQVKVAIAGDKSYGDSAKIPAATPWISLTKDWKVYELGMQGVDLSRVITPFCWVINQDQNGAGPVTFYLDDIYFVMEK